MFSPGSVVQLLYPYCALPLIKRNEETLGVHRREIDGEGLADSAACVALIYVTGFQSCFNHKRRGGIVRRLQCAR
jgi:hypothetical protein